MIPGDPRIPALACLLVVSLAVRLEADEPRFVAPLHLGQTSAPVGLAAGDFDGDGKLDLAVAGSSGEIEVLRQDPADRARWERTSLRVGLGTYWIGTADLDGDGLDELLAADPGTTAYVVPNRGGTFGAPESLEGTDTSRALAVGDFDGDGRLDIVSANHDQHTVAILLGSSEGGLRLAHSYLVPEPHAIESLDHDGDGDLDLAVVQYDHGLRILSGNGAGAFSTLEAAEGLTPYGRLLVTGDLDGDGRGDVALSCFEGDAGTGAIVVGLSNGDGTFRETLQLRDDEITPAALSDIDGDGNLDLAVVSPGRKVLSVLPGAGDGTFQPEVVFGPVGRRPSALIAEDLDRDGRRDVVSADFESPGATVFWGRDGRRFLESAIVIVGYNGSSTAVADLDSSGAPELFLPVANPPGVKVLLDPGLGERTPASATVPLEAPPSRVLVADLDGDGIPDVASASLAAETVEVTLLDAAGGVRLGQVLPAAGVPSAIAAGRLDARPTVDLAVVRTASADVALFLQREVARFEPGAPVPTIENPRLLEIADLDLDGAADLVVVSRGTVAVHRGRGDGTFAEASIVHDDSSRLVVDVAAGDVSGEPFPDIVVAAPGSGEVLVLEGLGGGAFAAAVPLEVSGVPRSVGVSDHDGDGRLDVTAATSDGIVALFPSLVGVGPGTPREVRTGVLQVLDHLVADLNRDRVPDLVVFAIGTTYIFKGAPSAPVGGTFRRGDADSSGSVNLTDAVALLEHLFRGGPRPCEDASDADDSGGLNLTDALAVLRWLFQGGPPPEPPGPGACGEDSTPDDSAGCAEACP